MKIVYTSRSLDMGNAFKEKCTEKLQSLEKFFKNDKKEPVIEIVSRKSNDRIRKIQVTLKASKGTFESEKTGEDVYALITSCIGDLKAQIIKAKKNNREERARIAGKHKHNTKLESFDD